MTDDSRHVDSGEALSTPHHERGGGRTADAGLDTPPVFLFSHPTFEENAAKLRRQLMWDWYLMAQVRTPPRPMQIIITDVS